MPITITAQELPKKANQLLLLSEKEPVFITQLGKIVGVFMNYNKFEQNNSSSKNINETSPNLTLADVFCSGHPVGDIDDNLDIDLLKIREQSYLKITEFE
ncbi:hypothetical protein A1D22_09075 [Pasteurellaceae bacterium LFhippo2]|nr:hypothetical protein [Pasteurellaceae bacterium LFhippo2]